ncbi:hypothetical protein CspeluHIS016_0901400 [Cutaneotrichosporon spelunceum]|uniref:Serine/threonine-protein phosphatase 2A activator n=1 Tax=Cutaneotrichosporon spelunceum TaxID=1672016 RepID=A0AAD3TZU0_9TREE|nr:hypothetical protein CspeluHIS016_0901400 [Cutaneotrichosporon spelunceum]
MPPPTATRAPRPLPSTSMPPPTAMLPPTSIPSRKLGDATAHPATQVPVHPTGAVILPSSPAAPVPVLTTEDAVQDWPATAGYRGFIDWLRVRCERIRGRPIVVGPSAYDGASETTTTFLRLLDAMIDWVDEVPPFPQENQRFGNRAFRDYIGLVDKRLPSHLPENLPPHLRDQLLPLLIQSHGFGHPTRLDYGTGHELAFILALWVCVVSGWAGDADAQDQLVLRVFPRYLDLTTKLQATYRLEPAGSHGVWGLDDFVFLPYLFGSAQLLGGPMSPAEALKAATTTEGPFTDMYTLTLHRVGFFKRGAAFSEHSPLLDSLSTFPNWVKPHSGLLKMYQAEVLGKRVVVQGLWVGGWCWGEHMPSPDVAPDDEPVSEGGAPTAAPWKTEQLRRANEAWGH